jgi:diguanylate cyclase (GGDEF)-like protein/PAS domain S-box-containing protein
MGSWEKNHVDEQNFFAIEQQLQSIARAIPDPIFIIDAYGKYLDVIGDEEQLLSYRDDFTIGKYLHDLFPENLADLFMQTISAAITDNSLKTIEYQLRSGEASDSSLEDLAENQWFEGRVYPIKDKNHEAHSVIWLAINITERKTLEDQLRELSEKDVLTGAYNRRYLMQIFDREFSIARRYKTILSVLHIDLDNFKDINGTFGYDSGDAVLKRLVIFCEDNLRDSDLFARYGGEEFIVMMPNTPSLGAAIIGERIRANIEEMSVTYKKQTIKFTISIGISSALDTDTDSTDILNRAREALNLAKKKGKNRIGIN